MKVKTLVVGQLQTNCYLVWDQKSKAAIIIDPGDAADFIFRQIRDLELKPQLIVATHGHFDHILAAKELQLGLKIPFLVHQKDLFLVKRMRSSARHWLGIEVGPPPKMDQFVKEADEIKFGTEKLKVIELPGHSPGGVGFFDRGEGIVFSGDTLFYRGVGRTDFGYASEKDLNASIKKLLQFPPATKVYPGHGQETTIGKEREIRLK